MKCYDFLSWLTSFLRLKDTHSNLGEIFSKEDGGDSMDMECALHRSENEIEEENQLNLAEAINSLTTSANLKKKNQKTRKGRIYKKKNMRFWKNLENR